MTSDCHANCPRCGAGLIAISVQPYGAVVRPRHMTRCPKYKRGSYLNKHICRALGDDEAQALAKFLRGEIV